MNGMDGRDAIIRANIGRNERNERNELHLIDNQTNHALNRTNNGLNG